MVKLPTILKAATKGRVNKLFNTSNIAIKQLERAKQQGLLPKAKVDAWIKQIEEQKEQVKKEKEKADE